MKDLQQQRRGMIMFWSNVRGMNLLAMLWLVWLWSTPVSMAMEPPVRSTPVRVVEVQSALRITVEANLGGLRITAPLQLDGIRLIGPPEHAFAKLQELCPQGCEIIVDVGEEGWTTDAFGAGRAWVLRDFSAPVDPATAAPAAAPGTRHRSSLQVELIRAGWAVFDQSHMSRTLSPLYLAEARKASEEARQRRMGAYSLPGHERLLVDEMNIISGRPQAEFVPLKPKEVTTAPAGGGDF